MHPGTIPQDSDKAVGFTSALTRIQVRSEQEGEFLFVWGRRAGSHLLLQQTHKCGISVTWDKLIWDTRGGELRNMVGVESEGSGA